MKTKLTLSMEEEKIKEFKKKAIDLNMTLSDYFVAAGTISPMTDIKKFSTHAGGAALPGEKYE